MTLETDGGRHRQQHRAPRALTDRRVFGDVAAFGAASSVIAGCAVRGVVLVHDALGAPGATAQSAGAALHAQIGAHGLVAGACAALVGAAVCVSARTARTVRAVWGAPHIPVGQLVMVGGEPGPEWLARTVRPVYLDEFLTRLVDVEYTDTATRATYEVDQVRSLTEADQARPDGVPTTSGSGECPL